MTYGGVNVFDLLESKSHPSYTDRPPIPRVDYDGLYDQLTAWLEAGLTDLENTSHLKRLVVYAWYVANKAVNSFQTYDLQKWREKEAEAARRKRK